MLQKLLKTQKTDSTQLNKFRTSFLTKRYISSTKRYISSTTSVPERLYFSLVDHSLTEFHLLQIISHLLIRNLYIRPSLITKLINKSASLSSIHYARKLFDVFRDPNVILYNSLIKCYCTHSLVHDAIEIYTQMHISRIAPDAFTFPCLLTVASLSIGRCIHAHVFRYGLHSDLFVQNGILLFYSRCGEMSSAEKVFLKLCSRSVVSWTLMINANSRNNRPLEALKLFGEMRKTVEADSVALVSVLKALSDVHDFVNAKATHGLVIKLGLENDSDLNISLITTYAKQGNLPGARTFFEKMETRSVTAWNAIISGYANNGRSQEAIALFRKMIEKGVKPDSVTLTSGCLACAQEGSLQAATWMDDIVAQSRYNNDVVVNTSLIDMYAKCGDLGCARSVFDRVEPKDTVLWSAMIMGFGLHGQWKESADLFDEMVRAGIEPNGVTFLGVLTACKNSGRVEDGWGLLRRMREYGVEPEQQHYACVVDLLARGGYIELAWEVVESMEIEASESVWGALLSGCEMHGHVKIGEYAARKLLALDCRSAGQYVQLSNLYASSDMWANVSKLRDQMKKTSLGKDVGYSLIQGQQFI